jgi:hypothetical protein
LADADNRTEDVYGGQMQNPQPIVAGAFGGGGGFLTHQGAQFATYYGDVLKRTGHTMPRRSDFKPNDARAFLPYLFIQEVIDPDTVIFRHVGTVIVSRTGADGTGMNFFDVVPPEVREHSWLHLRHLLDTPCGSRVVATEPYQDKHLVTEMVSFPFADKNGTPRFVIATSAEVSLQELALRGNYTLQFGQVISFEYLDTGHGV